MINLLSIKINQFSLLHSETTEEAVKGTEIFVAEVQKLKSPLVMPTITPRFALSCSKELLKQLGNIAKKYDPF